MNTTIVSKNLLQTSECVSDGHPDKFCDQVADRILDEVLKLAGPDPAQKKGIRTAIECLAKDNLLIVSGEVKIPTAVKVGLDIAAMAREVWDSVGYAHHGSLTVLDHIQAQSADIAIGGGQGGTDFGGAGDQGIMVGYATNETLEFLPKEYVIAKSICESLRTLRQSGRIAWLRSDCKTQVTLSESRATSIIVAAQHDDGVENEEIIRILTELAILPVLEKYRVSAPTSQNISINGTGRFVIGGTIGDAGVVGRKIVVDAYGPRVPVGGGAYSGKDFTKVDRSGAYIARMIAKHIVAHKIADSAECMVKIAYGIGKLQPEMVTAVNERGVDVSKYAMEKFPDLSPRFIIEHLNLYNPIGWSYFETASFGHYGREQFPWEKVS